MPGPIAVLLLLLSIAVLTVLIDRGRYWTLWWRGRQQRQNLWSERLRSNPGSAEGQLGEWGREMAFGEPLLQAVTLLAPLLGLIGTVLGLMQVLEQLGPQLLLPANANLQGYGRVLLATALGLILSCVSMAGLLLNQALRQWQLERLERRLRRFAP